MEEGISAVAIWQEQGVWIFNQPIHMMGTSLIVHVYWVDGMLVDSGPHRLEKSISAFSDRHRPTKIVHTHFHEDHTGNTAYLTEKFRVSAYVHPLSQDICRQKGDIPLYRLAYWGKRPGFEAEPLSEFIENAHSRFKVISTPGHTPDHVVFLDKEQGRLFSGDLFVHPKTRVVMNTENIPQVMDSLRRLLKEDFHTVFCSHAGVIKDGYHLIQQKLSNLEELRGEILRLREKGLEPKEITRKLFPQTPSITYFSLGEWSSLNLVRSVVND